MTDAADWPAILVWAAALVSCVLFWAAVGYAIWELT